jgi:hypothetical protein
MTHKMPRNKAGELEIRDATQSGVVLTMVIHMHSHVTDGSDKPSPTLFVSSKDWVKAFLLHPGNSDYKLINAPRAEVDDTALDEAMVAVCDEIEAIAGAELEPRSGSAA